MTEPQWKVRMQAGRGASPPAQPEGAMQAIEDARRHASPCSAERDAAPCDQSTGGSASVSKPAAYEEPGGRGASSSPSDASGKGDDGKDDDSSSSSETGRSQGRGPGAAMASGHRGARSEAHARAPRDDVLEDFLKSAGAGEIQARWKGRRERQPDAKPALRLQQRARASRSSSRSGRRSRRRSRAVKLNSPESSSGDVEHIIKLLRGVGLKTTARSLSREGPGSREGTVWPKTLLRAVAEVLELHSSERRAMRKVVRSALQAL